MRNLINYIAVYFVFALLGSFASAKEYPDQRFYQKRLGVHSLPATGFNRFLGQPMMRLGHFEYLGFETLAQHQENSNQPRPLSLSTKKSALLATHVDDEFLTNFAGGNGGQFLLPESLNVPLREVGVNFSPSGVEYLPALPADQVDNTALVFQPTQSLPAFPVRLKDWLKAKGKMSFDCHYDGTATVRMKMSGLLPDRTYTVWGFFEDTDVALPLQDFGPIRALGGISNSVVSDNKGAAEYMRILNFCPMNLRKEEVPLSAVFVYLHSDQMLYGAVMSYINEGRFPGSAGHVALQFPVSAASQHVKNFHQRLRLKIERRLTKRKPLNEGVFAGDPFFKNKKAPSRVVRGTLTAGWNRDLFGELVSEFPLDNGRFGFSTIGVYEPDSEQSILATENTPDNSIMATYTDDENFIGRFPAFGANTFINGGKDNIPFHMTKIPVDSTGLRAMSLPGILDVGQMDFSRAEPSGPITLGQYKKSRAIAKFSCPKGEMPRVVIKFQDLLPNRYFTVFEWFEVKQPDAPFDVFTRSVGGLPGAFTSNEYGDAEYRAHINRCPPLSSDAEGVALGWVVTMRQNHETQAHTLVAPVNPRDPRLPGEIATGNFTFILRSK